MTSKPFDSNTLFYGDNLEVLRKHFPNECIDLIYLDPPFNSKADYNILFREKSGKKSVAQAQAFSDFWTWDEVAERTYMEIQKDPKLTGMIQFLHAHLGRNDMMAYLVMMTIRLKELYRVLKKTGSIYLHCDPTASHYLKVIMDAVFEPWNFRSEIVWRRKNAHNKTSKQYGPIHDILLFYSKSDHFTFHPGKRPYVKSYIQNWFKGTDSKGRFRLNELTGSGVRHGSSGEPWRGIDPTPKGRHWAIPRELASVLPDNGDGMTAQEKLEFLANLPDSAIDLPRGGWPRYKQYVGDGLPYQDIWAYQPGTRGVLWESDEGIDQDVAWLESGPERLGFETQKPLGLLERPIRTSTEKGDIVLDPFCGCGTTIMSAQQLKRKWIGIDITHLAISLIRSRLKKIHIYADKDYKIVGEPVDLASAEKLASDDKYQFQYWAVSLIDAFPVGQSSQSPYGKKGADKGIDGWLTFKEGTSLDLKRIVVQVKGGHNVGAGEVRDLVGTVQNTQSAMGILITLDGPTQPMKIAAMEAGYYESPTWGHQYPKIQIITISELFNDKKPNIP